jgi:AAA15 family ATPase/GTPase
MLCQSGLGKPNRLDSADVADVPSRAVESSRSGEGGYKMIESLEINNFRCFDHVELDDLKIINLIVGRNASGKTALLEALYFTLGSPGLAFKLRTWRGMGSQVNYTEYTESRNALWRDLFHKFEQSRVVHIAFKGTGELERAVRISCRLRESQAVTTKKERAAISDIPPISFSYFRGTKLLGTVKPEFTGEGVVMKNSPQPAHGQFFPSVVPIDPKETANNFSSLSKKGEHQPIIDAVRELTAFNFIQELSIEIANDIPIVYASIEGVAEKMPLGLVSTGLSRLIAFLVAIATNPEGIVIVDEIENGFYFDSMKDIWELLRKFCEKYDVQLFASTHSAECLEAAGEAAAGKEDDFSLLRTERNKDVSIVRQFTGMSFRNAMMQDAEIR